MPRSHTIRNQSVHGLPYNYCQMNLSYDLCLYHKLIVQYIIFCNFFFHGMNMFIPMQNIIQGESLVLITPPPPNLMIFGNL